MEADSQPKPQEEERKLWSSWQTFYGTKTTNFMCSKCFKETQGDAAPAADSKKNKIIFIEDAKMEVQAVDKTTEEEEKKPERPVQVSSQVELNFIGKEEQMLDM